MYICNDFVKMVFICVLVQDEGGDEEEEGRAEGQEEAGVCLRL